MFKVNYINGERIESTSGASAVLGSACHKAMQMYLGGNPEMPTSADEGEAIKEGHEIGLAYITSIPDGFIEWTSTIPNRQKLLERYAFSYFGYIKESDYRNAKELLLIERKLEHKVSVDGKVLPVPLKGYPDVVYRDSEGRLCIDDHKWTGKISDADDIDANKLVQAVFMALLVAAELSEMPYKITFREFKITENRDKSPQTVPFEIVYEETPLAFDFFFRLYGDMTDALLGKMVYVPNFNARYDRVVSILAYIHRLDIDEERAKAFAAAKVDNISDFLKMKIQKDGYMKKYLDTVASKFVSATTLNYKEMKIEDRIKMKLAEHGLGVEFVDSIVGGAVTLYRYEPSIGIKMSKIESYSKDIEQAVGVSGIRILAPISNSELVGFEIPNEIRTFPTEKPVNEGYMIAIGVDIYGNAVRVDIREAPHILVAGATGSGKSVFLGATIPQLKAAPNSELVLIDPKMVELSHHQDSQTTYADDPKDIVRILSGLTKEMNYRYKVLKQAKKRNIAEDGTFSYIFVVIDEFGDLTVNPMYSQKIRTLLLTLAQKARAAGIHLILTTQRPSVKIIDGDIKMNFPTRIAFRTATEVDSHVILDDSGAEKLLGKGDMLLKTHEGLVRLQGYNI